MTGNLPDMAQEGFFRIGALRSIAPSARCDTIIGEVSLGILAAINSARRAIIVAIETWTTCDLPKLSKSQLEHDLSLPGPVFIHLVNGIRTDRAGATNYPVVTD